MAKHYSLGIYDYDRQKICELYDSNVDLVGQAYDIKYSIEMNGYHTLEFSIPYMIDASKIVGSDIVSMYGTAIFGISRFGSSSDGNEIKLRNYRWNFLCSDYLIRYSCDGIDTWFVASKPTKAKSGKKIYGSVVCSGYESLLKTRNIYMSFDDENGIGTIQYLMEQILLGTGWQFDADHSDTIYEKDGETEKVRSLNSDGKQGALGLITTVCNLFQARPEFDTDTMKVRIIAMKNRQQALEGEIGRNLTALTVKEDSSNISTRVYVEGEYGDYGYVGIDDVKVDSNGDPDPEGDAWGLPFLLNFDYYRKIGVFKQRHETALATYLSAIREKKTQIMAKGVELNECEDALNNLIGQCRLAVYYKDTSLVTPVYTFGDVTEAQARLNVDDDVVILRSNGSISYEKWTGQPSVQLIGAYGVVKFVTKAAGKIGAAEVQIESKEKEISNLRRKISVTVKADRIAEYNAEIYRLQDEMDAIYVGEATYDPMAAYAVDDKCSHNAGQHGDNYNYLTAYAYECTTAIPAHTEEHAWNASEWSQIAYGGLFKMMHDVMKPTGLFYEFDTITAELNQLNSEQDDIESTFIAAMGYMLRDGYWSNQNYTVGQEEFLYMDAVDMTKEMSHPTKDITFSYVRLTEEYDVPTEDIEINAIFKIWDEELGVDDNMFVKKITYGIDDKELGSVEVSNQDITLTGNDLGTLLSRMSQLADLIEQKNSMYERAKVISKNGSIYADRLNGQIDVVKNQILSSVSNWYTDDNGNILFIAADGNSAMMLSGAGFMLASSKTDDGDWDWRTLGTGKGITAEEIVAGFISAERIEAGSITTSHLSSEVGRDLDLTSNTSINLKIETELAYKLEIISTSDILSKDITSTTLTAKVWKGKNEVTTDIAASRFNWKRYTSDSAADATWNNSHRGMKSISLGCSDVDYSATYSCEVLSEEGT